MALSSTEKREIETLIKKEIKEFLNSNSLRQFEDKLVDEISKEIKRGKLEGDIKDLIVRSMSEFYQFLWTQRATWEGRVRRS